MDIFAVWELFLYTGRPEVYNMYRKLKQEAPRAEEPVRAEKDHAHGNAGAGDSGGQLQGIG